MKVVLAQINTTVGDLAGNEAKIRSAIEKEVSDLARLMVGKSDRELFGQTEFEVRDIVLRIGAKAYEEHLREKKTAIKAPA